jgi:hypothetical protein
MSRYLSVNPNFQLFLCTDRLPDPASNPTPPATVATPARTCSTRQAEPCTYKGHAPARTITRKVRP